MWRVAPESKLVVSVKTNLGQQSSAECGNHGYQNIKPRFSSAIPSLAPGDAHQLRAEIRDQRLQAFVDERLVWQAPLGAAAAVLHGPVGLRSDNADLEFELTVASPSESLPQDTVHCRSGPQEAE